VARESLVGVRMRGQRRTFYPLELRSRAASPTSRPFLFGYQRIRPADGQCVSPTIKSMAMGTSLEGRSLSKPRHSMASATAQRHGVVRVAQARDYRCCSNSASGSRKTHAVSMIAPVSGRDPSSDHNVSGCSPVALRRYRRPRVVGRSSTVLPRQ
jgi:hypothetical protein